MACCGSDGSGCSQVRIILLRRDWPLTQSPVPKASSPLSTKMRRLRRQTKSVSERGTERMRYLAPAALTHGPGQSRKPSTREGPTAGGGFLSGFASGELRPCPGHIGALVQRGGSPPCDVRRQRSHTATAMSLSRLRPTAPT
jgi:hypothetical protein